MKGSIILLVDLLICTNIMSSFLPCKVYSDEAKAKRQPSSEFV